MREQEYKARGRVVQKMARDGLSERDLAEGTDQRVSQRPADFSFRQEETGRSVESQESGGVRGNRKAYSRQTDRGRGQEFPAPMRKQEAGDGSHEMAKESPSFSVRGEKDGIPAEIPGSENSGAEETVGEIEPGSPAADIQREGAGTGRQPGRGRHGRGEQGKTAHGMDAQMKKRMQRENASAWREQESVPHSSDTDTDGDPAREDEKADIGSNRQENGEHFTGGKSHSGRNEGHSAGRTARGRESEEDGKSASHEPEAEKAGRRADAASRKLKRAEKRLETADRKLKRAKEKIPTRRRLTLETSEDSCTGKRKSRLRFEAEPIPEDQKPSLLKRTGGNVVHTAQLAASAKIHQKVRESEQDNVAVESAHKVEVVAEQAAGRVYRTVRKRLRTRPYRAVRRAEKGVALAERDAAYRKFLMENPEMQQKTLAKWIQKQKIKKKYAAAARKAAKGMGNAAGAAASTGKAVMRTAGYVGKSRAVLVIIATAILALALSGSLFSSCSSMFMGMGSAVTAACYLAEDTEINRSELRYTELETELQLDIAHTESDHPGYDEYRYNIGEIGHNPYELIGYLSAMFDDFTYTQIEAELYRLFGLQYELTREAVTETRTYLDEDGEEQEYDWHILKTVLTVRPLSGILSASLATGERTERYGIYMLTCGERQNYGSPFSFPWLGYVTSSYGYRVHPMSGDKDLHRGIDIAAPEGTPILAVQDGYVVSAGDAGGYGLCLVIQGEGGYQSRYAHCSFLAVSAGQEVRQGDVVAYVGNTGDSTGPHLHLEAVHNGEYLNPYFFVDNGGGGYTAAGNAAGRPQFPTDPGEPMGDGTFAAMLEVAERYMGYPYVWGGSSPSTSFDCSGYVSYVINQSGAGSVGRQTAQGLCNLCTPVSWEDLQPGDLVFFTGTYSSAAPVSHVGIYVGSGRMAHAGDPIGYADIGGSRYWREHFYCGGRLP